MVEDRERLKALARAANDQTFLGGAGAIVVAISDPEKSSRWHEKDTMIALEDVVLAATALGYGTCWIGAFDEDAVKSLLKIPAKMKVVALLPIGIPDENLLLNGEESFQRFSSKKSGSPLDARVNPRHQVTLHMPSRPAPDTTRQTRASAHRLLSLAFIQNAFGPEATKENFVPNLAFPYTRVKNAIIPFHNQQTKVSRQWFCAQRANV